MIDETTKKRLEVSTGDGVGPDLWVPLTQLEAARALLDRHGIQYWVDGDAYSLDNKPYRTVINFYRAADAVQIQAILDEAG